MFGVVILAGGRSKRMKQNKAFMILRDKPLLLHITEKILGLAQEIIVVIGKNDDEKKFSEILPPSIVIISDSVQNKGPLAGIYTGLQNLRSEYAVVLPCDTPFIKVDVFKYLFKRVGRADAAIPRWQNMNLEPLHAVYKVSSTIQAAKSALKKGELFIIDMINHLHRVVYVDIDEIRKIDRGLKTFFNINNQDDLTTAIEILNDENLRVHS
jgi:molybdopterin-guanine dinucleotide biosynthesis protein A